MASANVVLILTATINPRNCIFVGRSDPSIRLADYENALRQWLADPAVPRIVLCENSGSSCETLHAIAETAPPPRKAVKFLSYCAQDEGERGKGYGELGIISHVLQLPEIYDDTVILAASGRYYLSNSAAFINTFICQSADILTAPIIFPGWVESSVFCSTAHFLREYFCPKRLLIDDSADHLYEEVLVEAVIEARNAGLKHVVFQEPLALAGFSGLTGTLWTDELYRHKPKVRADYTIAVGGTYTRHLYSLLSAVAAGSKQTNGLNMLLDRMGQSAGDKDDGLVLTPEDLSLIAETVRESLETEVANELNPRGVDSTNMARRLVRDIQKYLGIRRAVSDVRVLRPE